MSRRRLFYLVLDGLGDEPCAELDGRTPLAAASTPYLSSLAREGEVYRLSILDSDGTASTHSGQLALLGYPPANGIPRRGPIEAAAVGLDLQPGDLALRGNFATADEHGQILDRRAGRIREGAIELAQALNGMELGDGVTALVRNATEHRLAIVLRGPNLDPAILDTDPKSLVLGPAMPVPVQPLRPEAEFAARKLDFFLKEARRILEVHPVNACRRMLGSPPANAILTRQAGGYVALPSLQAKFGLRAAAIAGELTVIGIFRLLGIEAHSLPSFTANVDTDLDAKFQLAVELLGRDYDLVLMHVKATDILAHDRRPREKADYLGKVDRALARIVPLLPQGVAVALASDHSTSSVTGDHLLTSIPAFFRAEGLTPSGIRAFDEPTLEEVDAPLLVNEGFFFRLARYLQ